MTFMALFRLVNVVFCSACILLLLGCSGNPKSVYVSETATTPPVTAKESPVAYTSPFQIPSGRMSEILSSASTFERPLLEDGVLTFSEYESATFATISCLIDHGMDVVHVDPAPVKSLSDAKPGPRLTSRGRYEFVVKYPAGRDLQSSSLDESRCRDSFSSVVALLWAEHLAPSQEEFQALRNATADCLRQRGEQVPANPSDDDLGRLGAEKVLPCLTTAKAELNWE